MPNTEFIYERDHKEAKKSLNYFVNSLDFYSKIVLVPVKAGDKYLTVTTSGIIFNDGSENSFDFKFNYNKKYTSLK